MYEHEKSILATIISYPDLLAVFLDKGGSEDWFMGSQCKITYQVIIELQENSRITWENVIEYSPIQIRATFIGELERRVDTPTPRIAEYHLITLMDEVDKFRKESEIINLVSGKDRLNAVDIMAIKEIIDKGISAKSEKEDSSMMAAFKEYDEWKDIERTGINTGFPTIDRYMGDLTWGEVFAIWGRTATGKTFVAINMLQHLVLSKVENIGFFSIEMAKSALVERLTQVYCGKHRNDIKTKDKKETESRFNGVKLYSKPYSVFEIEKIVKADNLKVIFIDFLQSISGNGISLYEKTTNLIQGIKAMAKNQNIIVILLVQLSRKAGEGATEVTLDMARDSGAIEENSDFVLAIWNLDKKIKKDESMKDTRAIKLIKNKRGEMVGADIYFNPATGKMIEEGSHDNPA